VYLVAASYEVVDVDGDVLALLKPGAHAAVDDLEAQHLVAFVHVVLVPPVRHCRVVVTPAGRIPKKKKLRHSSHIRLVRW
jgi:hypothetical protein